MKRVAKRRAFVTLDLLWIIVLLSFAVLLSIRGIGLVEKRDQSERLGRELAAIGHAVAELAKAEELEDGTEVQFEEYAPYLKKTLPKRLREEGEDQLGGKFGAQTVGEKAVADPDTAEKLTIDW